MSIGTTELVTPLSVAAGTSGQDEPVSPAEENSVRPSITAFFSAASEASVYIWPAENAAGVVPS